MNLPSVLPTLDAVPFILGNGGHVLGERREHSRSVAMHALLVGGGVMSPSTLEMRSISQSLWRDQAITVDNAPRHDVHPRYATTLEVAYLHAVQNEPFVAGSTPFPEPIQGRRFRVAVDPTDLLLQPPSLADRSLRVTGVEGTPVDPGLARRVARDHRGLGRPPLFRTFCPAGPIAPNTTMPITDDVARAWFAFDSRFTVQSATATYVGMSAVDGATPTREAVFQVTIGIRGDMVQDPAATVATIEAQLDGWVGVDPTTGERVSAQLSGPIEIAVSGQALGLPHRMTGGGRLDLSTRTKLLAEGT